MVTEENAVEVQAAAEVVKALAARCGERPVDFVLAHSEKELYKLAMAVLALRFRTLVNPED
jgi:hypothetical protein